MTNYSGHIVYTSLINLNDTCINRLDSNPASVPMFDAHPELPVQGSGRWHRTEDSKSAFCLVDVSEFRIVIGPKGRKTFLFPSEAELVQMERVERAKLKILPIQRMLNQARELQAKLNNSPDLTRDALAKSIGISPPYLTRLLNLLNLAPEIQEYIDALPPSKTKGKITESRMKQIARIEDLEVQKEVFQATFGVELMRAVTKQHGHSHFVR